MTKKILLLFLFASIAISQRVDCEAQTLANQPEAQQQSVRQILALGGDWEAPSKTLLIGFIGEKFTEEKFALLAPLVDVKILYFQDVAAKDDALFHCREMRDVWQLQIQSCAFSGVGFKHFAKAKNLKRLFIEDAPITDDGLASIAMLTNLELLYISCVETPTKITMDGLRRLRSLAKLKEMCITMPIASQETENELRQMLPNCKHISVEAWSGKQNDR